MENIDFLNECGLSAAETKMYVALLELGSSSAMPLIRKTSLQRSVIYYCLESLMKKGLVSFVVKNNVRIYNAEDPSVLLKLLKKRKERIATAEKTLNNFIKHIESEKKKIVLSPGRIFLGWNGLKAAFEDILKSLNEGDEYYVFGISQIPIPYKKFTNFLGQFHKKRSAKKIKSKLIISTHLKETIGKMRETELFTTVHYIDAEVPSPAITNIYKDKVLITMWIEEPFALLIQNQEIADSFRNYFLILWKNSK